jgi:DNA-binding LacI/PurR family transcriptional regulator
MVMTSGKLQRTTIGDVAAAAGVSMTTVSHALNGRGQVDARTRERVEQAARKLGYRPNRHAQRLRTGEAHMIALISSMPFAVSSGPSRLGFLMEIAAVAASAALSRGLALVLVPPAESGTLALDAIDIDAGLVVEPSAGDPSVEHLRRRGLPLVTIGKQPGTRQGVPCVDIRSAETTALLLEHLLARGARRIALLLGPEQRNSYLEAEEVYRAMTAHERMPCRIARADEAAGEQGGEQAAAELLAKHADIDALCVPVDAFAVGAVRAAQALGRRVPEDLLVATRYDGLRARTCEPPLTAVNLHLDETAQTAVELLLEQLRGDAAPRRVAMGPAPELVARRSTLR